MKPSALILAVLLASLLGACQQFTPVQPRTVRIAVMPFTAPETITERPWDLEGWWFGSRDVRQSRNVGNWTAESFARQLQTVDRVEVVPPYDLRRYLLEQRRTLRQAHPTLTDDQIDALLLDVPLSDYGRDLEVDKIITGQVFVSQTSHNRTIDVWGSRADFQIQVWDVVGMTDSDVETPEYEQRMEESEWFSSWLEASDKASVAIVEKMQREYFTNPGYFSNL